MLQSGMATIIYWHACFCHTCTCKHVNYKSTSLCNLCVLLIRRVCSSDTRFSLHKLQYVHNNVIYCTVTNVPRELIPRWLKAQEILLHDTPTSSFHIIPKVYNNGDCSKSSVEWCKCNCCYITHRFTSIMSL